MQSEDDSVDYEDSSSPLEMPEDDEDIDKSIEMEREAIGDTPEDDPDMPLLLNNLGFFLLRRFEQLGNLDDINECIKLRREAARIIPEDHSDKPSLLNYLGTSLFYRFERFGNLDDINESIEVGRNAVQLVPKGHPEKHSLLNNLGNFFFRRFEHLGNLDDINKAIEMGRDAVQLTDEDDPDMPCRLDNLGNSLFGRFEHLGHLDDINESIEMGRKALRLTPLRHPDRPGSLNNLGNSLFGRFEHLGSLDDINESIELARDAVLLIPEGHPDRPGSLTNLGNSLLRRFAHLGRLDDINESVEVGRYAVRLTAEGHPEKPRALNNVVNALFARFEHLGNVDDIIESIKLGRYAIQLTPEGHPDKAAWLSNLGNSVFGHFSHLGHLDDLNESINIRRDAVELTPEGHTEKSRRLNNLMNSLYGRFVQYGGFDDINESIRVGQDAVRLIPEGHPDRPGALNNLGGVLLARFERLSNLDDLNQSIEMKRDGVRLTPEGHANMPGWLNNLGNSLLVRFKHLGNLDDVNDSIDMKREAVRLTPEGHLERPGLLSNLGDSLLSRFRFLGHLDDINDSIEVARDAVRLTPEGHPERPRTLYHSGNSLMARFDHEPNSKDATEAIAQYSLAARGIGSPYFRFQASSAWSQLAQKVQHSSLLDAYLATLDLLPQLAWLGSPIRDRHFRIQSASAVVRRGGAAAINANKHIMSVEWLEQGRSIIWGQMLQLRTPLDALKASHPDLGSDLERVSRQVEGSSTASPLNDSTTNQSLEADAERYHNLAVERGKLIDRIRRLPGFESFLQPKEFKQLVQAADRAGDHIVMLNASKNRCDALILSPTNSDDAIHVPLPDVSLDKAMTLHDILQSLLPGDIPSTQDLSDRLHDPESKRLKANRVSDRDPQRQSFPSVLSSLWKWVVEPIVKALGLTTNHLRRLWWCPTGIFSFLPLHAAGDYAPDAPLGSKLMDYVISSYTPSVTALLQALDSRPQVPYSPSLLAVVQPAASGQILIPGTKEELKLIEDQADKAAISLTKLMHSEATVARVKEEMRTASCVHFACHGTQDVEHPTESALLLAGSSKLTLSEIIMMKLGSKDLAFLSACQTATGDATLSDESVHLAAGMLLAGYRGVIATMWTISDSQAPRVANDVYAHLFESLESGAPKAAEALHFAVKNLQASGADFSSWVSFIHLGI